MSRLVPTRPRHRLALVIALVAVVLVGVSPVFGRAPVRGNYRPVLPPDGLTNGCYPLPGGVVPDFEYVVRRDGIVIGGDGVRRRTVLQFDRTDAATATATIRRQFADAGVADDIEVSARDFDVPDDWVIQGEMVLDLPADPIAPDPPDPAVCADPGSTKRFAPDLGDDT